MKWASLQSLHRFLFVVMKRSVLIIVIVVGAGCAGSFGVQALGTQILKTFGLVPGDSVFDAAEGLAKATQNMSREEEYYLGRAVAAKILASYQLYENPDAIAYLNKVGLVLASHSNQPEVFGGYHFSILDTAEVNAMATPGGFIFITRGMLDLMPDEDALAAVLAHEISHVVEGHGVKSISQANMNQAVSTLGQMAGSMNCGEVIQQATTVFSAAVDDVTQTLLQKGYGRELEREADIGALMMLSRAGYDAHSLMVMLDQLGHAGKDSEGGWFETHPDLSDRQTTVAQNIEKNDLQRISQGKVERADRFHQIFRVPSSSSVDREQT